MADATKTGVHNFQKNADFDEAIKQPGTMIIDCFATWCGPCKVIAPKYVELSNTYSDARFYKLDVDELPEIAQRLKIRSMPTFLVYKDGEIVQEIIGANPPALEAAIKAHTVAA